MQSNGVLGRGSRYQPGLLGPSLAQPGEKVLMSEENFDEQFLQLDSNVNVNHRSPGKDESNQMNALEQALQDHLNKEKYEQNKQLTLDNNYEKYHLRIKHAGQQQISENNTAATSSGGNYLNFRSKRLVIRDQNNLHKKHLKSTEDEQELER